MMNTCELELYIVDELGVDGEGRVVDEGFEVVLELWETGDGNRVGG